MGNSAAALLPNWRAQPRAHARRKPRFAPAGRARAHAANPVANSPAPSSSHLPDAVSWPAIWKTSRQRLRSPRPIPSRRSEKGSRRRRICRWPSRVGRGAMTAAARRSEEEPEMSSMVPVWQRTQFDVTLGPTIHRIETHVADNVYLLNRGKMIEPVGTQVCRSHHTALRD